MKFNPQAITLIEEEYSWSSYEENYGYNAYWYEYLVEGDKISYKAYLTRVEPMTNLDRDMEPYNMVSEIPT